MHVALVDLQASAVRSAARELAEECPAVRIQGFACDVSRPPDVARLAEDVERSFGGARVGAVFANAGVLFAGKLESQPIQEWILTLNVNVIGIVNTIQAFLPLLKRSQGPSLLVTTSSIGGLMKGDGASASYMASKHAVIALTESLSFELARRHPQIRVHTLLPCQVRSGLDQTSRRNAATMEAEASAAADEDTAAAEGWRPSDAHQWMMTVEAHAQQVFDRIARAEFYVLGENVRPYVDHDLPFGALDLVRERYEGLLNLQLDNRDALDANTRFGPVGAPRSRVLKGPMFQEMRRLDEARLARRSSEGKDARPESKL